MLKESTWAGRHNCTAHVLSFKIVLSREAVLKSKTDNFGTVALHRTFSGIVERIGCRLLSFALKLCTQVLQLSFTLKPIATEVLHSSFAVQLHTETLHWCSRWINARQMPNIGLGADLHCSFWHWSFALKFCTGDLHFNFVLKFSVD